MNLERDATGPGIVVLSSTLQLLHVNRRAMDLLKELELPAESTSTERAITAPLHQHCQKIVESLQQRLASNNWEPFHQISKIGASPPSIFLQGFGLPDRRGLLHSRIVILLSPHIPVSMPGNSRMECSEGISETEQLGADP